MSASPKVELVELPLPDKVLHRVINPVVAWILRSPLHGLISDSILLITVIGRRTGTLYTTPVGYDRDGDTLYITTHHSNWWKNLRGGAPVRVQLQGEQRTGLGAVTEDPEEVAAFIDRYIDKHGIENAGRAGVRIAGDGRPSRDQLEAVAKDIHLVEVDLVTDVDFEAVAHS